MSAHCPVCGDPRAFPLWATKEQPLGCAYDTAWMEGGEPTVTNVTECSGQMKRAWQAAEFRRLMPDSFDENGAMKDGQLGYVLEAFAKAHPGKALAL